MNSNYNLKRNAAPTARGADCGADSAQCGTRLCASLGMRMKFRTLFMSGQIIFWKWSSRRAEKYATKKNRIYPSLTLQTAKLFPLKKVLRKSRRHGALDNCMTRTFSASEGQIKYYRTLHGAKMFVWWKKADLAVNMTNKNMRQLGVAHKIFANFSFLRRFRTSAPNWLRATPRPTVAPKIGRSPSWS